MNLHVSTTVSKLGANIPSINLPAIVTCRPDAPCCKHCYARKGCFSFPRNKALLENNLTLWQTNPSQFEREIILGVMAARFVRWHSSGDIPDENYLLMMIRVAERLPEVNFLCFTKKFYCVNRYISNGGKIPPNLTIVFSAWGDSFKPYNPFNLPVAYIRLKREECTIPSHARECGGFCGQCAASGNSCWNLKHGDAVVFNQH